METKKDANQSSDTISELTHRQWLLDLQLGWVRAADNKLLVVAPVATAMLGALFARVGSDIFDWSWHMLPSYAATFFLALSLVCCFSVASSRIEGPGNSLIFFGDIDKLKSKALGDRLDSQNEKDILEDLAAQIHINAAIATKKHASLTNAVLCVATSLPFWGVAMVLV